MVTGSQGDTMVSPTGEFQIDGLSPRKMAKVREVYSRRKNRWVHRYLTLLELVWWLGFVSFSMKIINWNTRGLGSRNKRRVVKDFLRSENPDVVMIQETKKVKCNKRFVGSVWTVRNKDWVTLPACGASSGILIIWDSKKLRSEVVIGSFSVSIKFDLVGCGPLWISAVYGPNSPSFRKDFWVELLDIFGSFSLLK